MYLLPHFLSQQLTVYFWQASHQHAFLLSFFDQQFLIWFFVGQQHQLLLTWAATDLIWKLYSHECLHLSRLRTSMKTAPW